MGAKRSAWGAALAALAVAACGGSGAVPSAAGAEPADHSLGNPDAPVLFVEYASITCPVCKAWHDQVWPDFKARFVDTGEVLFTFRELPTAPAEVSVAGFLVARCAADDRYFDVIDALFERQQDLIQAPRETLLSVAAAYGLNEAAFDACIRDEAKIAAIYGNVDRAAADAAEGTPSFIVNGEFVGAGLQSLAALEAAIAVAAE